MFKLPIIISIFSMYLVSISHQSTQNSDLIKLTECPENGDYEKKQKDCLFTVKCKIGDKFTYSAFNHGSVGIWIESKIADKSILKQDKKFKYNNPQISHPMPGGDEGTTQYIFTAKKEGKTALTIHKIYREVIYQKVTYVFIVK